MKRAYDDTWVLDKYPHFIKKCGLELSCETRSFHDIVSREKFLEIMGEYYKADEEQHWYMPIEEFKKYFYETVDTFKCVELFEDHAASYIDVWSFSQMKDNGEQIRKRFYAALRHNYGSFILCHIYTYEGK